MLQRITRGIAIDVDFRPKKLYFLSNITADVVIADSIIPPFYRATAHVRLMNPLPQVVRLHSFAVTARHLDLKGPVLYHYNHELKPPLVNPKLYVLPPSGEA